MISKKVGLKYRLFFVKDCSYLHINTLFMALDPRQVNFLYEQISNAKINSLTGTVSQLFEHLSENIKDNQIYDKYESGVANWENWPDENNSYGAEMPAKYYDAKELSYAIYKRFSIDESPHNLLYKITDEGNFNDGIYKLNSMFLGYLGKALEDILNANPELAATAPDKVSGKHVFIIHGHDEALKKDLQLLLIRAGVNNIVLHEQADKGRSIIDKLIEEGSDSNYAIGLFTPDDLTTTGEGRARQNVIFEMGYFLGRLGKDRVRILVKEGVSIPSDLAGIIYEKCDPAGAWKMRILKELQAVGIYVDLEAVMKTI